MVSATTVLMNMTITKSAKVRIGSWGLGLRVEEKV
jgi:hypothetical protein